MSDFSKEKAESHLVDRWLLAVGGVKEKRGGSSFLLFYYSDHIISLIGWDCNGKKVLFVNRIMVLSPYG